MGDRRISYKYKKSLFKKSKIDDVIEDDDEKETIEQLDKLVKEDGKSVEDYLDNNSIPLRIRAIDSSLPRSSISSVAPPGVICLPDTAVRTGHIT